MLTLPVYDLFKYQSKMFDGNNKRFYDAVGSGMISSLFMSIVVYPFDTAKRCM